MKLKTISLGFSLGLAFLFFACGPEPVPLEIEVTGADYQWHIRYPGNDGLLHSDDDILALRHVHLPSSTPVKIHLKSRDFIYAFRVPELKQSQMAIPDLDFALDFKTPAPGLFQLKGDQMCGFAHPDLIGELVVEPRAGFLDWLQQVQNSPP